MIAKAGFILNPCLTMRTGNHPITLRRLENVPASLASLSWTGTGAGSYSGTLNPVTITMNCPITDVATLQQLSGQLLVILASPANGALVHTGALTFTGKIGFVQGATVTVFLDGHKDCSGSTSVTGSFSCNYMVTKTGLSYSWYAIATKTGFMSGISPTWTFTY